MVNRPCTGSRPIWGSERGDPRGSVRRGRSRRAIFTSFISVAAASRLIVSPPFAAEWRHFGSTAPNLIFEGKAIGFAATSHLRTEYLPVNGSPG